MQLVINREMDEKFHHSLPEISGLWIIKNKLAIVAEVYKTAPQQYPTRN